MAENVWRTETVEGNPRHPKSHRSIAQIACHSTLQVILFALIMCLLTALSGCSDYQSGEAAYKRGDHKTALQELQPLGEKGNPKAQFHLGRMYARGNGIPQDDEKAAKLYKEAADSGDTIAQFVLGIWYEDGRGVPKDKGEAVKWFYKAAQQGSDLARCKLSRMFANSIDSAKNDEEKTDLYRKAAEAGYPQAQFSLGVIYEYGMGVDQNYVTAYMWYHRAGTLGIEGALEERDKITKKMSIVQITNAQRLAVNGNQRRRTNG